MRKGYFMKQKLSVLLACCLLLAAFPGCSSQNNSSVPDNDTPLSAQNNGNDAAGQDDGYTPEGEEKLHVTIESVEVTLDELNEHEHEVPLKIKLDKNQGVTNSEWGLYYDNSCTIVATNYEMIMNTVHAINEENHFLWTAWAGTECTDAGGILMLYVTLPQDTAPGDTYHFSYADTAATGSPHKWICNGDNYVDADAVGWTNGTITVVE